MILSIDYRVNSMQATQFRQWATKRLKDYLLDGYAINKKRLEEINLELKVLKNGISIITRAIVEQTVSEDRDYLKIFAKGLELLDDYDHESLDKKGKSKKETKYPKNEEYQSLNRLFYLSLRIIILKLLTY